MSCDDKANYNASFYDEHFDFIRISCLDAESGLSRIQPDRPVNLSRIAKELRRWRI